MTETQELLLRIMAITDAIWFPVPDWTTGDVRPKNVYLARQNFATGGVPVPSDAGDNAGRVAFTRLLQKAKADGLVTVSRTRSAPSAAMCKLTESGERQARDLCNLPFRVGSLNLLQEILDAKVNDAGWVSERALMPPDPDIHDRFGLLVTAAPGLRSRLVGGVQRHQGLLFPPRAAGGREGVAGA